ncbi:MAG TPA: amidohydrolase family protein [Gaiellales bacterium]|nr:amidohydrolase family protein [Gaiellales bacterium]
MPTAGFERVLSEHFERIRAALPEDIRVWDAHTHLGVDEDGFTQSPEELLAAMEAFGIERAFTFPLNDPERVPAYRVPNDRVLEWAAASNGALVPFCRLDLTEGPIAEAERCLDRGARGIKLHPRAQKFTFGEQALEPVFQLAAERRVPILIHAGRGLPAIADDLLHLVEHHPEAQLILAHAAIADLQHIGRTLLNHPNVLYDTSVWSNTDLRALLATASPEQIAFASDAPYGLGGVAQVQLGTALIRAGASPDQLRAIMWGNAERASRGEPAPVLSPPLVDRDRTVPLQRVRVHEYLIMATTLLWTRLPDMPGAIGLARRACDTNGNAELAVVEGLLDTAEELWGQALAIEDPQTARTYSRAAGRTLQIADSIVLDV